MEIKTKTNNSKIGLSPPNIFFIWGMGLLFHAEGGVGEFKQHDMDISYWTEKKKTLCRNVFWIFRLV